jgi:hypothetical protein
MAMLALGPRKKADHKRMKKPILANPIHLRSNFPDVAGLVRLLLRKKELTPWVNGVTLKLTLLLLKKSLLEEFFLEWLPANTLALGKFIIRLSGSFSQSTF